jgi:hypothetical protein
MDHTHLKIAIELMGGPYDRLCDHVIFLHPIELPTDPAECVCELSFYRRAKPERVVRYGPTEEIVEGRIIYRWIDE